MSALRIAIVFVVGFAGAALSGCDRAAQPSAASSSGTAPATPGASGAPGAPASSLAATAATGTPAAPRAAYLPTQAQLDVYKAEGPEPTLRKIAATDYWLNYKLMQATGIEKTLGGEERAVAILKKIGETYERNVRGTAGNAPKMIKAAAFTGEGMSAGFLGLGAGSFLGFISGSTIGALVTDMSDSQLAELNKKGGFKGSSKDGFYDFQVAQDGSLTQTMEFDVNMGGVNGKVKMKSKLDACPDADGRVTVEIEMDSAMSLSNKPGSGGHVHTQFKYERYVNDDAKLIDTADGAASNLRVQMGGYENFQSQSVDIVMGYGRGGEEIFENHGEQGYSIFRPDEVKRTQDLLRATQFLQTLMAEAMLRGMGSSNGAPWESGHCINLQVTSSPGERTHLKPSTAFRLEARPRVKSDGAPAKGTVTATLTGGSTLQPASGKVPADANYQYVGPGKKNETATIAFESRSKRGVGKASLEFDTKVMGGYRMEGGAAELHFKGQVCDLEQTFALRSEGELNDVKLIFVPDSKDRGRYSYSGTMSGYDDKGKKYTFRVHGKGTYDVKYVNEIATSIAARGPGTVETPYGPQNGEGAEKYALEPLADDATCMPGG